MFEDSEAKETWISTFSSFCLFLFRQNPNEIRWSNKPLRWQCSLPLWWVSEQQVGANLTIPTQQIPAAANISVVCFSEGNGSRHCLHKPRSFHPLTRISQRNTLRDTIYPRRKTNKNPFWFWSYHFKNIAIVMISSLEAHIFLTDIVIVFKSEPEQSHLRVSFFSFCEVYFTEN